MFDHPDFPREVETFLNFIPARSLEGIGVG